MSEQFFYVHLKFIPKIVTLAVTILRQREVVVEVSKHLVQHSQSRLLNENPGEKAIALDLARRVALDTFPTVAGRFLGLYDEAAPTWHEQRHHVMNERPCDHEENGTRAWRIIQKLGNGPSECSGPDFRQNFVSKGQTHRAPSALREL